MKHKVKLVKNLMYVGCEPHWECVRCGRYIPVHCYSKDEIESMCCGCHKINCNGCKESEDTE